ncbi:hypothetical protein GZH46_02578 [Fragariocoptes setiger]|uniref:Nose resistant-to-fluoxetine protein N-terminal domain-containing protein n=1 Tax=Fragariocoptes setiger TaxID=1670756 RepID=A0ABQ7S6C6_9ACAR|nr:hypothetical protein GZH46_02578 [Fragariocoptes setiger]
MALIRISNQEEEEEKKPICTTDVAKMARATIRQVKSVTSSSIVVITLISILLSFIIAAQTGTTSDSNATSVESSNRIPAVNYTLVEQEFNYVVPNDDELVRKWKALDATMKSGIQAAVKSLFPRIVSMATDARVSGDCSGAMLKWMISLQSMKSWSIKMLDAIGKPSPGTLEGSLTLFGDYGQCLNLRAPEEDETEITGQFVEYFRGKYCVLHIKPQLTERQKYFTINSTIDSLKRRTSKPYDRNLYDDLSELAIAFHYTSIRADLCVPSMCSKDDIQRFASHLGKLMDMRMQVMRCETSPPDGALTIAIDKLRLLWAFGAVLVVSSITLMMLVHTKRRTKNTDITKKQFGGDNLNVIEPLTTSKVTPATSMSNASHDEELSTDVNTNSSHTSSTEDKLSNIKHSSSDKHIKRRVKTILNGVMGIVLLWIILVNTLSTLPYQFLRHLLPLRGHMLNIGSLLVVNSTLQFDSVIIISAFTYAYLHMGSTMSRMCAYVVTTYVRRVAPMILLIAAVVWTSGLSGYWHQSPVWADVVAPVGQACLSTGVYNLAFIQNYLSANMSICLPHTWLLCVELQLLVLVGIPMVYCLNKLFRTNNSATSNSDDEDKQQQQQLPTTVVSKKQASQTSIDQIGAVKARLVSCSLVTFGSLVAAYQVYGYGLPPAYFYTFPDLRDRHAYWWAHLGRAMTHLVPFVVGLRSGHAARRISDEQAHQCDRIRKQCAPLWQTGGPYGRCLLASLAIVTMMVSIWSPWAFMWATGTMSLPGPVCSAIYDLTCRLLWSLACGWLLFQLITPVSTMLHCYDNKCHVMKCLSHPFLVVCGRRWALIYLIYPWISSLVIGTQQQASFSSPLMLIYVLIGNMLLTLAIAHVLHKFIDRPLRRACRPLIARANLIPRRRTVGDVTAV